MLLSLLPACGEVGDPGATDGDTSESGTTDSDGTTDGTGGSTASPSTDSPGSSTSSSGTGDPPDPTTGDDATTAPVTTSGPTSDSTSGTTTSGTTTDGTDGTTTDGTTTDGTTTDSTTGVDPGAPVLPAPTAECPEIIDGTVEFHPAGLDSPRAVRIWFDPDAADQADGPLVFYWYGTGGEPDQALTGVGDLAIQEVLDMGGIVVAPTHDPMAGVFPWYLVLSQTLDDLLLADEIVACAEQQIGIDDERIYTLGFSAGALHTSQMSIRRSNYVASDVTYSGGLIFGAMPEFENPDNHFNSMLFHGGPGDMVVVGFQQATEDYAAYLDGNDNFNFICNHGDGHTIPPVQDSVFQFFFDHPWGTTPSPYMQALPGDFPDYCSL